MKIDIKMFSMGALTGLVVFMLYMYVSQQIHRTPAQQNTAPEINSLEIEVIDY